jgi:hypothetical protein
VTAVNEMRASAIQRGMWLTQKISPDSPEFTVSTATQLFGPVDPQILRASLSNLVSGHAILRSRFVERDGELYVEQMRDIRVPLIEVDFSSDPPGTARRLARARVESMVARPFDMSHPPLLRAGLIRVAADEHVLHVDLHHAVCDGWSVRLLLRELADRYAVAVGSGAHVPEASNGRSADYWEYLRRGDKPSGIGHGSDLTFWRECLAGVLLPTLPGQAAGRSGATGGQAQFIVDRELLARVDELAGRLNTTRFVLLAAAFQVVLSRLCGTDDVPIGTTLSLRDTDDAQRVYKRSTLGRAGASEYAVRDRACRSTRHSRVEGAQPLVQRVIRG